jgi:hypothetical protein
MSWDDTELPTVPAMSSRGIAGLVLGAVSLLLTTAAMGVVLLNARPVEPIGCDLVILLGVFSIVVAIVSIVTSFRARGGLYGLPFALAGAGIAPVAMFNATVLLKAQAATDRRMAVGNNLKRLAVALHDYEQAHGALPPAAVYDKDGKPLLSWRVLILPYLEQEHLAERGLFRQFKLDEPWGSPHNLALLERMPKVYAPPKGIATPEPYTTYYQVFVGKGAAFEGTRGISVADFPDGKENTFLVVEAATAVPWTKPQDIPYAPDQPLPDLDGMFRHHLAVMADGSVRRIPSDADPATIRAFITRNGHDGPVPEW